MSNNTAESSSRILWFRPGVVVLFHFSRYHSIYFVVLAILDFFSGEVERISDDDKIHIHSILVLWTNSAVFIFASTKMIFKCMRISLQAVEDFVGLPKGVRFTCHASNTKCNCHYWRAVRLELSSVTFTVTVLLSETK